MSAIAVDPTRLGNTNITSFKAYNSEMETHDSLVDVGNAARDELGGRGERVFASRYWEICTT